MKDIRMRNDRLYTLRGMRVAKTGQTHTGTDTKSDFFPDVSYENRNPDV